MSESENLKSKLMFYMIFVAIDLFIIIRVPVTARSVSHDKPRIFSPLAPTTGPVPIKLPPPASPGLVILGLGEPLETARSLSAGLAEMFLPAILLKDADLLVRYVTAVVSVSSVLFFSASIPCILATRIPVSVGQLVVIWFLRTLLGIVLAALCGKLAMAAGWLS